MWDNPYIRLCHHYKDDCLEWAICELSGDFFQISFLCNDTALVAYAREHFSNEKRRCQWLASRMVVRSLIGDAVSVVNDADGKPRLIGDGRSVSISHTTGYVAVAFHTKQALGIDIERRGEKVLKVRNRFISPREEQQLDHNDELTSLLLHWSAKESFYKIIGNRGGSYVASFLVAPFVVADSGKFTISYLEQGVIQKSVAVNYIAERDYVFTLCVDV